jgi:predicted ferric reductase
MQKKGTILLILYCLIALLPSGVAYLSWVSTKSFMYELGRNVAFVALMIIALQFFLASRLHEIESPFGFDVVIRFHRYMGIFATVLLLCHPLLLAVGGHGWHLIYGLELPWFIWFGKVALLLLLVNILLSLYQITLSVKFERWRLIHDILGPTILILIFFHSWFAGNDLRLDIMKILWIIIFGFTLAVYMFHRFIRPKLLKNNPYRVSDVKSEADDVWTIKLKPADGSSVFNYAPGQFQFITFYRDRQLPVEEHHWTISSSPAQKNYISSTIKALGDFTSTIGQTRVGDTASVQGPFGRFSYLYHPEEKNLVFLAGGIGITPLMSMLRHMRDTKSNHFVVLIYGNEDEHQIIFREELSQIETGGYPKLNVFHVLHNPPARWTGETGYINKEKIQKFGGEKLHEKIFYVCGPPPMVGSIIKSLKQLGVPDRQIRMEVFSFLD